MSDKHEAEVDIFVAQSVHPDSAALFDASYKRVEEIVESADIVLDANVLLAPYGTGKNSLAQLKTVYGQLRGADRLFVPAQAAREYTLWRARKLTALYQRLADRRGKAVKPPREALPVLEAVDGFEALTEAEEALESAIKTYQTRIDDVLAQIRAWSLQDPVTTLYKEVLGGGCIRELEFDEKQFEEDLDFRFRNQIPPGYKDSTKRDKGVGDLLIWRTILAVGEERKNDLIFVTGEEKADWQHRADNRGLFPRLELVDEYRRSSDGGTFHIVALSRLLELLDADETVVEEIRTQETSARDRIDIVVGCPFCEAPVPWLIRPIPGGSAKPRCRECGEWFHAHWRDDGPPTVRLPNTATADERGDREEVSVTCPSCSSASTCLLGRRVGSSALPSCTECGNRFHVHRVGSGLVITNEKGGGADDEAGLDGEDQRSI